MFDFFASSRSICLPPKRLSTPYLAVCMLCRACLFSLKLAQSFLSFPSCLAAGTSKYNPTRTFELLGLAEFESLPVPFKTKPTKNVYHLSPLSRSTTATRSALTLSLSLSALRESCHGSHFPLISKMQFFSFSSFFRDRREKKTRSGDRKTRVVVHETLVVNETHRLWRTQRTSLKKRRFSRSFHSDTKGTRIWQNGYTIVR